MVVDAYTLLHLYIYIIRAADPSCGLRVTLLYYTCHGGRGGVGEREGRAFSRRPTSPQEHHRERQQRQQRWTAEHWYRRRIGSLIVAGRRGLVADPAGRFAPGHRYAVLFVRVQFPVADHIHGRTIEPELAHRSGIRSVNAHPEIVEFPEITILEEICGTCADHVL